jgi:hypothetical protein
VAAGGGSIAAEAQIAGRRVVRSTIVAIASVLGLGLGAADSGARCLAYEPTQVVLVGTVTSRTLPGPPNYRSIGSGDYPETVFILRLKEPICVSGDPSSRRNRNGRSDVTEVQLMTRGVDLRRFLGGQVRASGSLFSAYMDSHRTPVVMNVIRLRAAAR